MSVPCRPRRANRSTATPVTNMASVESMNAAPRMAMTGIRVSGMAVATAASTLPTAPSARFSLWPNHSIPFVNSSAPTRIRPSEASSSTMSIGRSASAEERGGGQAGQQQDEHAARHQAGTHLSQAGESDGDYRQLQGWHEGQQQKPGPGQRGLAKREAYEHHDRRGGGPELHAGRQPAAEDVRRADQAAIPAAR